MCYINAKYYYQAAAAIMQKKMLKMGPSFLYDEGTLLLCAATTPLCLVFWSKTTVIRSACCRKVVAEPYMASKLHKPILQGNRPIVTLCIRG